MNTEYRDRIWLKHYPPGLPATIETSHSTALDLWEKAVSEGTHRPAIYYFDSSFTYGWINDQASALASGMANLGISKGDRVILQLQNIPQYLVGLYATWKLGAIAVPLNPMYKSRELDFYIRDSGATVIITMEACWPEVSPLLESTPLRHILTTCELDLFQADEPLPPALKESRKLKPERGIDLLEFISQHSHQKTPPPLLGPQDPAYLTYTSGTTGPPKGAINTHANVVFSACVYRLACGLNQKDVVVAVAPFFHVTGGIGHVAVASLLGIPMIAFFRFDPGELLRLLEKWRGSMMIAPLTVFVALLNHPTLKTRDLSSMRALMSGGAPVPEGFVARFEEASGLYIHNWYGLTETTSPAIITPIGCRSPVDKESGALSVGVPVPGSYARIVDVTTGEPLSPGTIGELLLRGPMVVPGYWDRPAETAHAIQDGWLYTGDMARMDDDGWFYLVDRKKDLINVSGYKVWPRDVEDVLYQHPAVKEACVIGVSDPYRGETVKAYVTLADKVTHPPQPGDLIAFCKQRMAAYKYPRDVEIVPELPKTLSGKILRREMRKVAMAENH